MKYFKRLNTGTESYTAMLNTNMIMDSVNKFNTIQKWIEMLNPRRQIILKAKRTNTEINQGSSGNALNQLGVYSNERKQHTNIILDIESETFHNKGKILNQFNSFTTIATTLARNLPQPLNEYDINSNIFPSFY